MGIRVHDPVLIARQFLYVRELPGNRGLRVEAIQHWADGQPGDSWCMEALWMWLDIAYQGVPPFGRMQAVQDLHVLAKAKGWIVSVHQKGDIVMTVNSEGHAHHVGLVTAVDPLRSIAGNTSEDGISSNGDRVAEHAISKKGKIFVRVPV